MEIGLSETGYIYQGHDGALTKTPKGFIDSMMPVLVGRKKTRSYRYKVGFRREEEIVTLDQITADKFTTLAHWRAFERELEQILVNNQVQTIIAESVSNPRLESAFLFMGFERFRDRVRSIAALKYPSVAPAYRKELG